MSAGIVPKTAQGGYEVRDCVRAYINYLRACAVVGESSEREGLDDKARLLKFKADIAQYEAERMAGRLGEVDSRQGLVRRGYGGSCEARRRARQTRPTRRVGRKHPRGVQILEEAIHECLTELSNMPIEVVNEMPADDLEDAA